MTATLPTSVNQQDAFLEHINGTKTLPYKLQELEKAAETLLPPEHFGYIQSGAGSEYSMDNNRSAFDSYSIVPRFLQNVSKVDTSIDLFGNIYETPFLLAPIGMMKLAHEDAEIAVAKAAAKQSIPFIQSTVSSRSIEDINAAVPDSAKWFQLYWSNQEDISFSMVRRAERAGYEAIVVTVDTVMLGWREVDMEHQFSPLKAGFGKANYETDPVFLQGLSDQSTETIVQRVLENVHHPALHWDHIKKLREHTNLPILLKGILHPEDALTAIQYGVDGIIVSNHGARQLDGVIASLDALPPIIDAVGSRVPVLLDSGIRHGSDVIKALKLGARAVFLGRPYIYALALGGQEGVETLLSRFKQEIAVSLALAGVKDIQALDHIQLAQK